MAGARLLRLALAVVVSCSPHPDTDARVPHPSQSHREGWDANGPPGLPVAVVVACSPQSAKNAGCPILRSLIAKGGMQPSPRPILTVAVKIQQGFSLTSNR